MILFLGILVCCLHGSFEYLEEIGTSTVNCESSSLLWVLSEVSNTTHNWDYLSYWYVYIESPRFDISDEWNSETFIRNSPHIFPHQRLQTLDCCSFSLVHAEGHAEFRVESSIKEVQASYDWPNNTYKKHWVDHLKSHVQCPRWFSGCFCSAYDSFGRQTRINIWFEWGKNGRTDSKTKTSLHFHRLLALILQLQPLQPSLAKSKGCTGFATLSIKNMYR